MTPRLIPNLLGLWVYAHDLVPRCTPPDLWWYDGRYWINTADVDAFHRWASSNTPFVFKYQTRETRVL